MQRPLFGREPALWINVIAAALSMIVSLGLPGLDDGKALAIVAIFTAAAGIFTAWHTRPIALGLFTGFGSAALTVAASYGLHLTQAQVGAVQLFVVMVATLIARGQITPVADPRPLYPSATTQVRTAVPDRRHNL